MDRVGILNAFRSDRIAAIDTERHARHHGSIVGGQPERGFRNILWRGKPAKRNGAFQCCARFRRVFRQKHLQSLTVAFRRAQAIHTNVPLRKLQRHGFRGAHHPALGRAIPGETLARMQPRGRRRIDDNTAALMLHDRHDELRRIVKRLHVHRDDEIEIMLVHIGQRHVAVRETSIVDHNVDTAEFFKSSARHTLHVILARNIRLDGNAVTADIGKPVLDALHIHIGQNHPGTLGCKPARHAQTEAGTGAGDNRDLILQPIHVILLW
ncbi:Conserved hypothetical protein [Brucella canis ATCC 23365]|uniref:Uncharacterized protein n=1 Tax=Brucella canis (strain ATCC 23365 / NCTC 10854 / RM-666) TaxID=483179 RepID=A9MC61_BRUC2|nr:Conserved hypothetical protein [Brucella canis ATCC 23365]